MNFTLQFRFTGSSDEYGPKLMAYYAYQYI